MKKSKYEKIIKVLAGYSVLMSGYAIVVNVSMLGQVVSVTTRPVAITSLALLPVLIFAVLVMVYLKKKDQMMD
ncbi:hypothetical protein HYV91_00445 [Candidatus Wolfebacteria bacterium]|nr:hypothetical protein [Candidatus Wolfebacteria bacterium]